MSVLVPTAARQRRYRLSVLTPRLFGVAVFADSTLKKSRRKPRDGRVPCLRGGISGLPGLSAKWAARSLSSCPLRSNEKKSGIREKGGGNRESVLSCLPSGYRASRDLNGCSQPRAGAGGSGIRYVSLHACWRLGRGPPLPALLVRRGQWRYADPAKQRRHRHACCNFGCWSCP